MAKRPRLPISSRRGSSRNAGVTGPAPARPPAVVAWLGAGAVAASLAGCPTLGGPPPPQAPPPQPPQGQPPQPDPGDGNGEIDARPAELPDAMPIVPPQPAPPDGWTSPPPQVPPPQVPPQDKPPQPRPPQVRPPQIAPQVDDGLEAMAAPPRLSPFDR